ncbi:MAG: hypothetical protein IJ007_06225 [Oscillospiraceae bacterium]|nr:hypothetical protein [Oscillospiraceae bacterium]
MAYADYNFYTEIYKGTLSESEFECSSERASDYIDSKTGHMLTAVSAEQELRIKKACCAAAEIYASAKKGGVKSAESVDGYSVTYAINENRTIKQQLDDVIQLYIPDLVQEVGWI